MALNYKCSITINLPSEHHALIMKSALEVDEDIQPHRMTKAFSIHQDQLIVSLAACDLKLLRIGVSSFTDMAAVCAKTILEFE